MAENKPAEAPKEEAKAGDAGAAGAAGAPAGGAPGGAPGLEPGFIHKTLINTKKDFAKMYLNSDKEKKFLEQMRRWKVVIKEIYITPLEEMFDPFLEFTIGGDFGVPK